MSKEIPKIAEIVGTVETMSGGLFSSQKEIDPTDFNILDWRWGSAVIIDMKNMEEKHPSIQFLVKNDSMQRSRWTRPFPVRDFVPNGKGGFKKVEE